MKSITSRLVLKNTITFALVLIICGVTALLLSIYYLLYKDAAREVRNAIQTIQKVEGSGNWWDLHSLYHLLQRDNLQIQVISPEKVILYASTGLEDKPLEQTYINCPVLTNFQDKLVFWGSVKIKGNFIIHIIRFFVIDGKFLRAFFFVFCIIGIIGLLLSACAGWLVTKAALEPVRQLTRTAQSISTSELTSRIPLNGPADELSRLAETFNQMLDRLEQGFHSQQDFLNAASHDLRTPLAIIKSYTNVLNRWGKDDPNVVREAIPATIKAVEVMERLVNDLLMVANLQAKTPLHFSPMFLDELVEEVIRESRIFAEDLIIRLKTLEPLTVEVDEYYLRRVLWILMDNAIKYNRPGGEIAVSVFRSDNSEAVIQISDTGVGIEARELPKIFNHFYRSCPSRGQGNGFGLGLSLAKEIVQAHHGRIEVESKLGQGSVFRVILPAQLN